MHTLDQRGVARDADPDLGAIESTPLGSSARATPIAEGTERDVEAPRAAAAHAKIVVTVSRDTANSNLSEDNISLREAIQIANRSPGRDQIEFADDIGTIRLRDGLPTIAGDLRLVGGGDVVLDANSQGDVNRRCLDIEGQGLDVVIDGLTVTGGWYDGEGGGGIRSGRSVDLTVIDCDISGNGTGYSYAGAGIQARGDLTMLRCRVTDNEAGGPGGGVAVFGTGVIRHSLIEGNYTYFGGGGVYAAGGLTVAHSEILGNRASTPDTYSNFTAGGGIQAKGDLTLLRSRVAENYAANGGGISIGGAALVNRSIVESNEAFAYNATSAGGGVHAGGDIYVVRSMVVGNATYEAGGGIFAEGNVTLFRSDVSDNKILRGFENGGGGVDAIGTVTATLSRVADNRASGDLLYGGGIFADVVRLDRSEVSGNVVDSRSGFGGGISARRVDVNASSITDNVVVGVRDLQGGGVFAQRIDAFSSTDRLERGSRWHGPGGPPRRWRRALGVRALRPG